MNAKSRWVWLLVESREARNLVTPAMRKTAKREARRSLRREGRAETRRAQ